MDPAYHAAQLIAEAAEQDAKAMVMLPIRIPARRIDGAVVELQVHPDGIVTAEIRIPGREYGPIPRDLPFGNDAA